MTKVLPSKRLLPVESVVGPLQRKLNKSVRMQLRLFDGCLPERREGVTHELQVLSLSIQEGGGCLQTRHWWLSH